jgi:hypothetical protein
MHQPCHQAPLEAKYKIANAALPLVTRHRNYLHRDVNIPASNAVFQVEGVLPAGIFAL